MYCILCNDGDTVLHVDNKLSLEIRDGLVDYYCDIKSTYSYTDSFKQSVDNLMEYVNKHASLYAMFCFDIALEFNGNSLDNLKITNMVVHNTEPTE